MTKVKALSLLQRGVIHTSYSHALLARFSSTTTTLCPTQAIVTNTNSENTETATMIQYKNALNNIPTRILHQLLKKNRIRVCCTGNHDNYKWSTCASKKLLISKLYRLIAHKKQYKTRVEINTFATISSELVRKTCLKLRDLNTYYNTNYHMIINDSNHLIHHTLSTLITQIDSFNMNIFEIGTTIMNPSIDTPIDCCKRDFLYELLPTTHNDNDMIVLAESFIRFMDFPRFTLFDHIQYISHLCVIDSILNGFLMHRMDRVHPSRKRYQSYHEYNDDDDEYDDAGEFETEKAQKHSVPMDEDMIKELNFSRLKNIYSMDLSQYGLFGVDENVVTQLKRALLSRGLDPGFINKESNESNGMHIDHNKGILLYGPPGTGKTLLAKALTKLLLSEEDNVSIVAGPEIEDVYIGQTERNIRNLFKAAEKDYKEYGIYSPLHIIIFDEIDSIAKKRDSTSNSKVYDRAVQQLLSCLDGANALPNVLTIATTNRYQDIDNALLRPGRFGVHIYMGLPDKQQRYELFTKYEMETQHNSDNIEWLIDLTEALSHSDIVALITQSKINAIERIIQQWFEDTHEDHMDHNHLYEKIRDTFVITSQDIVCALDEIRINQVYRERNNSMHTDIYAYDIVL